MNAVRPRMSRFIASRICASVRDVDGARRLVEDQDRGVLQERSSERDPLALAAREAHSALADRGVVAVRQRDDEVVRARRFRGGHDVGLAGVRARVRDVLGDARREQHRLLEHDRELVAQIGQPVLAKIDAVEQDLTGARIVEARQEAHERRLPGSCRPGDAEPRAGRDLERDVIEARGGRGS